MERKEFIDTYGPVAEITGKKLGVESSVLLGQWGLETGWGKSIIPGTNNPGNIKDFSGKGTAATDNMTGSRDKYATYKTPEDFGNAYASLISRKYPGASGSGSDAVAYATALKKGGYAEDPSYVKKVASAADKVLSFLVPSANASENDPMAGFKPAKAAPSTKSTQSAPANDPMADFKPAKKAEPGWFEPGSKSEAAVRGFSQGATLGFGDEIQAGIRAGVDKITGNSDKPFTEQYAQYRDEERVANKAASEANGDTYMAGNIVGAAPSAIVATPAAAGTLPAVAGGAAYGAVAGFGGGEGSMANQATDAAVGATIGGVAAPIANKVIPAVAKYGKAAVTEGIPAAVKAGTGAAVKEGLEWGGGNAALRGLSTLGKAWRGEDIVKPTLAEIAKPAIAHAVPGGYGVAAAATVGKGIYAGAKAGVQATKEAVEAAGNQPKPQWSNLFERLKTNPETSETAAQDLFTQQQTSSAARAESLDRPAYMRREKVVQEPVVPEPKMPPPKPAGPTAEQLAGKKPAPVAETPVAEPIPETVPTPEPTVNTSGSFTALKDYVKPKASDAVEGDAIAEMRARVMARKQATPVNEEVVTPNIAPTKSQVPTAPEGTELPTRGSSMTVEEARNAIRKRALENAGDPVDALNAAFGGRPMTAKLTSVDKEKAFDIIARRGTGNSRESVKKYNGSKYKTIQDVYDEIYGTKG